MNSYIEAHKDKLSHCVLVFGAAGLLFYTAMVIANSAFKYGVQMLVFMKGIGL